MWAQQDLVGRVVAILQAAPAVAQLVTRRTSRPVDGDIATAVRVRLGPSRGAAMAMSGGAPIDWDLSFITECVARSSGAGQAPDEAVGPVVVAVFARLLADTTLAAAGFQLMPEFGVQPDQDELDERIGQASFIFSVRHRTAYNSIES